MKKSIKVIIAAVVLLGVFVAYQTTFGTPFKQYDTEQKELEAVIIEKIVDGDTLSVKKDNQSDTVYVRLIGIDTPESVHPDQAKNSEDGKLASDFTASIVEIGDQVFLQKDVSDTDQYGRLLRYVWLEIPNDVKDEEEVRSKMLNAIILDNGMGKAVRYEPDIEYYFVLKKIEIEKDD